MAGLAFPSMAYNATQPPQVVANQAALTALGAGWVLTPFPPVSQIAPFDPGFVDTDVRLQQIMVELRLANQYLYANGQGTPLSALDEPTVLRTDIAANDVTLAS